MIRTGLVYSINASSSKEMWRVEYCVFLYETTRKSNKRSAERRPGERKTRALPKQWNEDSNTNQCRSVARAMTQIRVRKYMERARGGAIQSESNDCFLRAGTNCEDSRVEFGSVTTHPIEGKRGREWSGERTHGGCIGWSPYSWSGSSIVEHIF